VAVIATLARCVVVIAVVLASGSASAGHVEPTVVMTGNSVFTTDEVLGGIEPYSLVEASGAISQEAVERHSLLITAFYWDRGYAQVRVSEPKVDPSKHRIDYTITEGPLFKLGTIRVTGTLLRTERNFLAMLASKPGAVFSRSKISGDREKLNTFYEDRAYAHANVLPLTRVDLATRTINLTFEITQGELSFIEKITVVGNVKIAEHAIRDQLLFKAAEPFHRTRLDASRRRLLDLGVFQEVWVVTRKGSSPSLIDIMVEVVE